jgi:Putative auto-transporter adhesin, head GIN domain
MKRAVLYGVNMILLILFIMPASCMTSQSFQPIRGSGTPVDKNFKVSDFHGIDVSGGFDVILVQGNSEDLTLTAQENLFEHITVKVDQGILRIYTEKNIMSNKPMKARISFKSIDNLKVSGGGDIECKTPVNVPKLDVHISGGGDLNAEINADELKCRISGGGDAEIDGNIKNYNIEMTGGGDIKSYLNAGIIDCSISGGGDLTLRDKEKVDDAHIIVSGGGDITVEMNAEKLKCSVSGGGDATFTGQASGFEIAMNGGGDMNAGDFITATTSINISGGSDIHVNVTKELSGTISGGGDVYYSGNPVSVSVDAKGGSKIYKQ